MFLVPAPRPLAYLTLLGLQSSTLVIEAECFGDQESICNCALQRHCGGYCDRHVIIVLFGGHRLDWQSLRLMQEAIRTPFNNLIQLTTNLPIQSPLRWNRNPLVGSANQIRLDSLRTPDGTSSTAAIFFLNIQLH